MGASVAEQNCGTVLPITEETGRMRETAENRANITRGIYCVEQRNLQEFRIQSVINTREKELCGRSLTGVAVVRTSVRAGMRSGTGKKFYCIVCFYFDSDNSVI